MNSNTESAFQSGVIESKAKLKWFNAAKGFGFVIPEVDPVDAFLHITQLQRLGVHGLGEGAEILCRVEYGEKGASVLEVISVLNPGSCSSDTVVYDPEQLDGAYRTKGIVKLYAEEKGYGFITPDDGMKDIFVHKSCLDKASIEMIYPGQRVRVSFKVAEKGREATEISIDGDI
ncbi:MAG TPA: cold shock domain-containing protein [Alphaproteobacteria bacterium]|nr:cold shock domain-containing protein [Alphaproteobacteria bacterium]HNS43601.1 cold shock domain-containing protein [Alphaproteobacteria bacterium]